MPGDYLGDGRTEIAVFRPSTGQWFIRGAAVVTWGATGDVPVPGDATGNGKVNPTVFRPSTGQWWARGGSPAVWGRAGDIPLSGEFSGDVRADQVVFRPSTGTYHVRSQEPRAMAESPASARSLTALMRRVGITMPSARSGAMTAVLGMSADFPNGNADVFVVTMPADFSSVTSRWYKIRAWKVYGTEAIRVGGDPDNPTVIGNQAAIDEFGAPFELPPDQADDVPMPVFEVTGGGSTYRLIYTSTASISSENASNGTTPTLRELRENPFSARNLF